MDWFLSEVTRCHTVTFGFEDNYEVVATHPIQRGMWLNDVCSFRSRGIVHPLPLPTGDWRKTRVLTGRERTEELLRGSVRPINPNLNLVAFQILKGPSSVADKVSRGLDRNPKDLLFSVTVTCQRSL